MKKRLDLILVERGLFDTREKAKREIMAGNVIVNEQAVTKAGTNFKNTDELSIRVKDRLKYVSRGGLKLEKAIKIWNLDFKDKTILDIGASTGGFTDCALQNGAMKVYSVDVGTNQLDWRLKNDERVVSIEEMHIKDLTSDDVENDKDLREIAKNNDKVRQYLDEKEPNYQGDKRQFYKLREVTVKDLESLKIEEVPVINIVHETRGRGKAYTMGAFRYTTINKFIKAKTTEEL